MAAAPAVLVHNELDAPAVAVVVSVLELRVLSKWSCAELSAVSEEAVATVPDASDVSEWAVAVAAE